MRSRTRTAIARARSGLVGCLVGACVLLGSERARADDTNDAPEATRLRERAEAEIATGNLAEACPLLASAYAKDHEALTLFSSAKCLDASRKFASAHAAYSELLALPETRFPDEARRFSRARHAELGPRLSRLTVRIPAEIRKLVGVRVTLDGAEIPEEAWDVPHARDAGKTTITIAIPGRAPFSVVVTLPAEGADEVVDLPNDAFPRASAAAVQVGPPTSIVRVRVPSRARTDYVVDTSTFGPYQTAGATAFAVGAAGLGVGLVVGLLAAADYNRAAQSCSAGLSLTPSSAVVCNDRDNVAASELAREKGDVGTVIGGIGAGVALVGAGMYFFGPRPSKSNGISLRPMPSRGLGASVAGTF